MDAHVEHKIVTSPAVLTRPSNTPATLYHMADLTAFLKPHYADEPLGPVVSDWLAELTNRPVSIQTVLTYDKALRNFTRSLTLHDKPLTLGSITESNVMVWKTDMREGRIQPPAGGRSHNHPRVVGPAAPSTIRGYVNVLKVFSNRWIKRRYTEHDLLDLVDLGKDVVEPKVTFTVDERRRMLDTVEGGSFEQVRDRAYIQLMLATACRFKEIYGLSTTTVDLETKRMWVVLKGGRQVPVDVDGRALRDLRTYIGRRRSVAASNESHLWLSDSGRPLTYWGAYGIFNRLEERSGVKCNPHKFRHTVAQAAAQAGAPVADVQDLLHHSSDQMARRYIGNARQDVAAGLAKKWSLAG